MPFARIDLLRSVAFLVQAMSARKLARDFRIKFCAAPLHLTSHCQEIDRPANSSQHAATLIELLTGGTLSCPERDDLSALILESTDGWVPRDRSRLVQAVNAKEIVRHRRCSQEWCENALNIFSQPELDAWTNRGAAGMNSTLTEIITRVMQLGGKLICEDTKKLLCALWLFYRGDGRELGNCGREIALKIFKDLSLIHI